MFYATGVDKIRQNIAKIWDAVKFRNTLIKKKYILKYCTKGQTLYYQSRTQQIKPQLTLIKVLEINVQKIASFRYR